MGKRRELQKQALFEADELEPAKRPSKVTELDIATWALFGQPASDPEWGRWRKAAKALRQAQVSPTELASLTAAYINKFPEAAVTLMAVATRVGELRKWIGMGSPDRVALARQIKWQQAELRLRQEEIAREYERVADDLQDD